MPFVDPMAGLCCVWDQLKKLIKIVLKVFQNQKKLITKIFNKIKKTVMQIKNKAYSTNFK